MKAEIIKAIRLCGRTIGYIGEDQCAGSRYHVWFNIKGISTDHLAQGHGDDLMGAIINARIDALNFVKNAQILADELAELEL